MRFFHIFKFCSYDTHLSTECRNHLKMVPCLDSVEMNSNGDKSGQKNIANKSSGYWEFDDVGLEFRHASLWGKSEVNSEILIIKDL